ncbi:MAG: hypothetical protein ACOZF0_05865 [Thermodesulfobacteriota bacterium]
MNRFCLFLTLLACCFPDAVWSELPIPLPAELAPWRDWVLYEKEELSCPSMHDKADVHQCAWPETLELDMGPGGGVFKQNWTILAPGWLPLPGDKDDWPQNVTLNNEAAPVVLHDGFPAVFVSKGRYAAAGEFKWKQLPQTFRIPSLSGLISLKVNGEKIGSPFLDEDNRIWIQKQKDLSEHSREKNSLQVQVFRLMEDNAPFTVTTLIRLTVSGERRREKISSLLLPDSRPVQLSSPLPARLAEKGEVWVEVKPGQWDIQLVAVINAVVTDIGPVEVPYGNEIWVYKPMPHLRMAAMEGLKPIDPTQTTLPLEWRQYAAFLATGNDHALIRESQRGVSPTTPDSMRLHREMWLDFDGGGATVRDRIIGKNGMRRFIGLEPSTYTLGRLIREGNDQLVTRFGTDRTGMEMEKGPVEFSAVSRLEHLVSGRPFRIGWNCEFQEAEGTVHLPPGWRLLGVKGGIVPEGAAWITQWTLLDFFIILIIAMGIGKLRNWKWGVLFWVGLLLTWQEPYAPGYVWAVLIVTTALRARQREMPAASPRMTSITIWHSAVLLFLAANSLVFSLAQLRTAMYPQLEIHGWVMPLEQLAPEMKAETAPAPSIGRQMRQPFTSIVEKTTRPYQAAEAKKVATPYWTMPDAATITQTGPGIPDWRWNTVDIRYGMVTGESSVVFWLLPPAVNSLIAALRVLLVLVLALFFFNVNPFAHLHWKKWAGRSALLLPAACILGFHSHAFGAFPTNDLLMELEKRLLKPHDCYPHCAAISDLDVNVLPAGEAGEELPNLEILFSVSAPIRTVIPLPAGEKSWTPYDLLLDSLPQASILREGNALYLLVPEGRHKVLLKGRSVSGRQLRFVFPLKPSRVTVSAPGWRISGLTDRQQVDNILQLNRDAAEADNQEPLITGAASQLTDFLRIKRELMLGLEWKVVTSVERFFLTKDQRAVSVGIPLLPGELVRTEGLEVKEGKLLLEMAADMNRISWESSIPLSGQIFLEAPVSAQWSEIWHLQASPLWHYTAKGIPAAAEDDITGSVWYPWPGEKLQVELTRLEPAPGQSLTIDAVKVDFHIGESHHLLQLQTRIRTSRGGPHPITPPEGAVLKQVTIDGKKLPLSTGSRKIFLPLQPGNQVVDLEWRLPASPRKSWLSELARPRKLIFPSLDLNADTNNIEMFLHLPPRCWLLLTGGPRLGPAVLMWGFIVAVILIAFLLGKFAKAPLSTHQWLLLGIGLITLDAIACVLVVAWFIVMEARRRYFPKKTWLFNLMQCALLVWTLIVIVSLYQTVAQGLLGIPDMQVAGNGSGQELLHWTQDRAGGSPPRPWVIAGSMYLFRIAMFAWALWLAANLFAWGKWAVATLRVDGFWKKRHRAVS